MLHTTRESLSICLSIPCWFGQRVRTRRWSFPAGHKEKANGEGEVCDICCSGSNSFPIFLCFPIHSGKAFAYVSRGVALLPSTRRKALESVFSQEKPMGECHKGEEFLRLGQIRWVSCLEERSSVFRSIWFLCMMKKRNAMYVNHARKIKRQYTELLKLYFVLASKRVSFPIGLTNGYEHSSFQIPLKSVSSTDAVFHPAYDEIPRIRCREPPWSSQERKSAKQGEPNREEFEWIEGS